MTERDEELHDLAAELRERNAVEDAFVASSFDDRLVIVDVADDGTVPEAVRETMESNGLRGAGEVYGTEDARGGSFAGAIEGVTRHHFLDVRARSEP